jgi:tripartite ATP-independent transporter DctM subunit
MRSIPALLVPIIIVGGIATGLGTPTEASSLAVAFALLLAVGLYRNVSGRGVLELVGQSAVMAGMLVFIISLAAAFTEMLTLATIPQQLADALGSITGEAWLFLVIVVLALIVMGAVLEGLPAILVLAPILMPLADDYGIDQLHFGIVMLIALGIGAFAPPIGIGMYTACAVTDSKIEQVMKPMLPYLVTLVVGVLIVAFVPFLCLALPEALGLGR